MVIVIVAALVVAIAIGGHSLLGGGAKSEVGDIIESGGNSSLSAGSKPVVGEIIEFGGYEWRVLEVRGDRALIISAKLIELRAYNVDYHDVTWESCDLRYYLNGDFYNSFTTAERKRIEETRNTNADNPWYGTSGGRDTDDMVFLLSLDEVVRYFGDSGELRNGANRDDGYISDQYDSERIAIFSGHGNDKASWWWLRSPGYGSDHAAGVGIIGYVFVGGDGLGVHYYDGGVRPALWLKL